MVPRHLLLSGLCVVFFIAVAHSSIEKVGCYKDDVRKGRTMKYAGFVYSVKQCINLCKNKKKPFAAVQHGYGCYCGTSYDKYGTSTKCTMKCPSGENCGGVSTNMVYKVYNQGATAIGCFNDYPPKRAMTYKAHVSYVRQCVDICKKQNYLYAGLQFGGGCYCGKNYAQYGKSSECTKTCASGENCGGFSKNMVYKIYYAPPTKVGCYKDDVRKGRTMKYAGFVYSVKPCINLCKNKKKPFAAVQHGYGCYCGTSYDKYGTSTKCTMKCPSGENCGGVSTNMVYKVYDQGATAIGCFNDYPPKRAMTYKAHVSYVRQCVDICKKQNYLYAGLQSGGGCYCGKNYAQYGKSSGCTKTCASGENCGGFSKNMVYKISP